MDQVLHHRRVRMRGLLAPLLTTLALAAQPLTSQAQDEAARIERHVNQALQPLTAAEIDQVTAALQSDDRARARLATNQRVRTVLVERHEEDKGAPTGQRRADVVLYNYDTNETTSAVVTLGAEPQSRAPYSHPGPTTGRGHPGGGGSAATGAGSPHRASGAASHRPGRARERALRHAHAGPGCCARRPLFDPSLRRTVLQHPECRPRH